MRSIITIIIGWLMWGIPLHTSAQQIRVEDFARLKKPFLAAKPYATDKQRAMLDLYTSESGFEITIGKEAVETVEGDGMLTLMLPDGTEFFTIKHPDYGQLTWKAPEELRRKHHYRANLLTENPDKEYRQEEQWAVFHFHPEQAIITIDSLLFRTLEGTLQVCLPIGKHAVRVESPFHHAYEDTIRLDEHRRLEKEIHLQPFYSYLAVDTHMPQAEIRLDGQIIGLSRAQSKRLRPGTYELTVQQDSFLLYRETIRLNEAERKVIDLKTSLGYHGKAAGPAADAPTDPTQEVSATGFHPVALQPPVLRPDSIHIRAFDDETEIWVNREQVGKGQWKEELPPGMHAVSTRKDGLESRTQYIMVGDGDGVRLHTAAPTTAYGWLNISCNVVDAEVWIDGKPAGKSPCILPALPADKSYHIRLSKTGYKDTETIVTLRPNEQTHINLNLKNKP